MNIVLTGYRGTGKTTSGKILAKKLKRAFIDTDEELERLAKMRTPEIVGRHGWKHFRKFETEATNAALKRKNAVIATGAGALVENKISKTKLKKAVVVLLTAEKKEIAKRIKGSDRPALTGKGTLKEINEVMKRREKKYLRIADIVIDTTDISPEKTAGLITALLKTTKVKA